MIFLEQIFDEDTQVMDGLEGWLMLMLIAASAYDIIVNSFDAATSGYMYNM